MNLQPIEKRIARPDGLLSVHSIFHTIQGEGPFCGYPAVFIRLAGCNLQCPLCDTDYTSKRRLREAHHIVNDVRALAKRCLVVITGGEPFRQALALGPLIEALLRENYFVQVETNGTLAPPEHLIWNKSTDQRYGAYIVCSPKAGKVHPFTAANACCFKYVLSADSVDPSDGLPQFALDHSAAPRVARPPRSYDGPVYLQPVDVKDERENLRHLDAVKASCMRFGYVLQLQVHKILEME